MIDWGLGVNVFLSLLQHEVVGKVKVVDLAYQRERDLNQLSGSEGEARWQSDRVASQIRAMLDQNTFLPTVCRHILRLLYQTDGALFLILFLALSQLAKPILLL